MGFGAINLKGFPFKYRIVSIPALGASKSAAASEPGELADSYAEVLGDGVLTPDAIRNVEIRPVPLYDSVATL